MSVAARGCPRRLIALALVLLSGATVASFMAPALAGPRSGASGGGTPGTGSPAATEAIGGVRLASPGIVVNYPSPNSPRLPDVPDSAYVIADATTGQVLAAKDAHGLFPPASTLKVLTAITMIPLLNPDATVIASRRAASVEPNIVGLVPGRSYKVADLFRALLMISANDAAVSLVEASGSFDKGMALMNAEARRLRAYDVVAKQPNGLPANGQHVSAYDLALIARRALSMPAFMRYDSALTAPFQIAPGKAITMSNQNSLLTQYQGGIGGKIGWTEAAEATYIGLARRDGVTLIVTELHCTPLTEITSAEQLLSWGFDMDGKVEPVGDLVSPLPSATAAKTDHAAKTARRSGGAPATVVASAGFGAAVSRDGLLALAIGAGVSAVGFAAWVRRRARSTQAPGSRPGP